MRAVSLSVSSCAPANNTPLPLERSPPGSFKRLLDSSVIGAQPKNGSNCTGPECNDEKQRSVPPTRTHFGARLIRGTLHLRSYGEEQHHAGAEAKDRKSVV